MNTVLYRQFGIPVKWGQSTFNCIPMWVKFWCYCYKWSKTGWILICFISRLRFHHLRKPFSFFEPVKTVFLKFLYGDPTQKWYKWQYFCRSSHDNKVLLCVINECTLFVLYLANVVLSHVSISSALCDLWPWPSDYPQCSWLDPQPLASRQAF